MFWKYSLVFAVVFFLNSLSTLLAQTEENDETPDPDFFLNNYLFGTYHELTVEIGALREDCFFQHISKGANFYFSFEVLRGDDRKIDMIVKDPNNQIIETLYYKSDGAMKKEIETEGIYTVCLDNTFSRFSSKRVVFSLYAQTPNKWSEYIQQLEGLHNMSALLKSSLTHVEESVMEMRKHQSRSGANILRDWYLVKGNNRYVGYYSVIQCIIIIISSCAQVYVMRRFFRSTTVTPTSKPRA